MLGSIPLPVRIEFLNPPSHTRHHLWRSSFLSPWVSTTPRTFDFSHRSSYWRAFRTSAAPDLIPQSFPCNSYQTISFCGDRVYSNPSRTSVLIFGTFSLHQRNFASRVSFSLLAGQPPHEANTTDLQPYRFLLPRPYVRCV